MPQVLLTDFENKVLEELKKVPCGRITTYKDLARKIGYPRAARAVGNALNKNPFAPRIPCHRVIKSDGTIGGYARGRNEKVKLLKKEGINISNNKIVDFKEKRC